MVVTLDAVVVSLAVMVFVETPVLAGTVAVRAGLVVETLQLTTASFVLELTMFAFSVLVLKKAKISPTAAVVAVSGLLVCHYAHSSWCWSMLQASWSSARRPSYAMSLAYNQHERKDTILIVREIPDF
jgi:hypothetical protein